ncbi:MAG: DNA polymerase IV [Erysipelotrichaceae bacterium]|nr:DNA polymerase IV [Erysipelotrichaceae bacterium]
MERVILHCDLNGFYASVEELYHPEYRGQPLVVAGEVELRHGIVLAKNQLAKQYDIQTGETIWQAKQKCPTLVVLPPNHSRYLTFSKRVHQIFLDYTDRMEPFGIDEAWLDVTESIHLFGDGKEIADQIRERIKQELGITASVGVSYNKAFAKLGSDYRKPDATTVISRENKVEIVDPLPVEDLLFVGRATKKRLHDFGIWTIGELASQSLPFLKQILGKQGEVLWKFANGLDESKVQHFQYQQPVKSIGNSTTPPKDIEDVQQAQIVLSVLADSVACRLREQHLVCQKISLYVRDVELHSFVRQCVLKHATQSADDLWKQAMRLLKQNVCFDVPLRSVGIRAMDLKKENIPQQLSFFSDEQMDEKNLQLEKTVDAIRKRFGFYSVRRGLMLLDPTLSEFEPKQD